MSITRDLSALAVGFAAGDITQEALSDKLGGDHNLISKVISMAGGLGVGMIAGSATKAIINNTPLGDVADAVDDIIDDVIGGIFGSDW